MPSLAPCVIAISPYALKVSISSSYQFTIKYTITINVFENFFEKVNLLFSIGALKKFQYFHFLKGVVI
ncbi:hypothetical protein (plasmid) [Clostridium perfringens str. 13]|uniref:Uncharacterized protein n=1 Tax=Clostridium perfringens (strain 13 / Type A) TaxID=195102 RepID=Q93MA5_CLOPE|nr:hypothetical protein [Clostridium perfringens str. 13]